MSYRVEVSSPAQRNLSRLPPKAYLAVAEFIAGPLGKEPRRVGKPLRNEFKGMYSARVGVYRVIYEIDDVVRVVNVVRVGYRADVYRPD